MKDIIPAKKESPILGLSGMGGGVGSNLGGSLEDPSYIEDVFSTYLYTGSNSSSQTFNTGIDLTKGGAVWIKNRGSTYGHQMFDTIRGVNKRLRIDLANAQDTAANTLTAFNDNGFTIGTSGEVSDHVTDHASWSFRKQKGFFDVVTYTGTGINRTISHGLGCKPGLIMIKSTTHGADWIVYHKSLGPQKAMIINNNDNESVGATYFNSTEPTASTFTLGTHTAPNSNGQTYIAYLFAGGQSTAAAARSLEVDGTGDYLNTTTSSSDFTMGTGDYTVECWVKADDVTSQGIFDITTASGGLKTGTSNNLSVWVASNDTIKFSAAGSEQQPPIKAQNGQWHHVALARNSGTTSLYVDGTLSKSVADTFNHNGSYIAVGGYYNTDYLWEGHISNFRVVKGTAVYTSSFVPPTEPLTNISGTVLLCCNSSSVAGSTVTPVTLNSMGNPVASTDSPFHDPGCYKFGEEGDQNIIECGTYRGNGSTDGPTIDLGWEPQWLLFKRTNNSSLEPWMLFDVMRGCGQQNSDNDRDLRPSLTTAEGNARQYLDIMSNGFKITNNQLSMNSSSTDYIYMAIRRPDALITKPVEDATKVFAMDVGNSSTSIPNFDSGFPVDMGIVRNWTSAQEWEIATRMTGQNYWAMESTRTKNDAGVFVWDSNTGWIGHSSYNSSQLSWMWKRHAGFDVVSYMGDGNAGRAVKHSLGRAPEMMWVKTRGLFGSTGGWRVYHKGLNGGSSAENYGMYINTSAAQYLSSSSWNETVPTSTHFTVGTNSEVNGAGNYFIAMLFASVEGVSKVGYYAGQNTDLTLNLGFSPRYMFIKQTNGTHVWMCFDTHRGITTGNVPHLHFNSQGAQTTDRDWLDPVANGIKINSSGLPEVNNAGNSYIYYAHA